MPGDTVIQLGGKSQRKKTGAAAAYDIVSFVCLYWSGRTYAQYRELKFVILTSQVFLSLRLS